MRSYLIVFVVANERSGDANREMASNVSLGSVAAG